MNDAKYIGLDVHQATVSVAVRDCTGKLLMEAILETKAETILQFLCSRQKPKASSRQKHESAEKGKTRESLNSTWAG